MAARRPPERTNLYLIGMMGSGKTTLGRLLAQALERPFLDTDELVERREGRTIPQIFEEEGEAYFREVEARCVLEASRLGGAVVALGGGAVLREENRRVLRATGRSSRSSPPSTSRSASRCCVGCWPPASPTTSGRPTWSWRTRGRPRPPSAPS